MIGVSLYGQIPNLPTIERPNAAGLFKASESGIMSSPSRNVQPKQFNTPSYNRNDGARMHNQVINDQNEVNREIQRQTNELMAESYAKNYLLSSLSDKKGTGAYYTAFGNLLKFDPENYSLADATFLVENAFYDNDKAFQNTYQNHIQKATNIIRNQMKKNGVDDSDNVSKNLAIFQYFAEDSKQNGKVVHKAVKYDFDDYFGSEDYSKMFVSKLMKTNTGQCHSMPLLYLILAEQIGAEANLVMSPNHSYIRFKDDDGEMLSVELTNGMFSANSFVLNSGYVKSEALQNKLYMQNLNKREVLSQTFVDLASGYVHKFGYDEFVSKVIDRALELNPNNINATLWKSNTDQKRFIEACKRKGIDPENKEQLQNIKNYPPLVEQFHNINQGFDYIDHSGFAQMPIDQYDKWLGSLKSTENKQKSEEIAERLRILNAQKRKEAQQKPKSITPKKEAPKVYMIPKEFL